MCVEGDDVVHSEIAQLLESHGAVERLSARASVLPSFVEHGHDNGDASCLAAYGAYGALEVCVVVVGAHHIVPAVHLVGHAVVEHIADDKDIVAANGLLNVAFRFARTEARECRFDEI